MFELQAELTTFYHRTSFLLKRIAEKQWLSRLGYFADNMNLIRPEKQPRVFAASDKI